MDLYSNIPFLLGGKDPKYLVHFDIKFTSLWCSVYPFYDVRRHSYKCFNVLFSLVKALVMSYLGMFCSVDNRIDRVFSLIS